MGFRKPKLTGRKPDKLMRDAIILELNEVAKEADGVVTKKLRCVARALVEQAMSGDVPAIKEINNRVDGRLPLAVGSPKDADGVGPLVVEIVRFGELTSDE
ncbi:MAG: hypothetical protein MI824_05200 [Hyphomicrobiales bacterium]|nr:hypothetical protein [Hyphomicrobiales bacterium]